MHEENKEQLTVADCVYAAFHPAEKPFFLFFVIVFF
jgi:hypothetical protein